MELQLVGLPWHAARARMKALQQPMVVALHERRVWLSDYVDELLDLAALILQLITSPHLRHR
jgi:hypothetical protein